MNELISRRIKHARENSGLTQVQLTEKLGFKDRQTVAAIEAGQLKIAVDEPDLNGRLAMDDAFAIICMRLVELPFCNSYTGPVAQFPRLANAAGRFCL